ncbi:MAG: GntR family transcriptional regulator [Chitinivibrionales bacterium]|nr:GntR family transcriptional regulator [Chitinivibrionales bacterium]
MKKLRANTAVYAAYQFLVTAMIENNYKENEQLPGLKELARLAQVSVPSMAKATALLKKQSVLEGVNGRRCKVKIGAVGKCQSLRESTDSPNELPSISHTAWQRVCYQVKNDILTGSLSAASPLPSMKELQTRYATSFRTLKKALYELYIEDFLVLNKKHYSIRQITAQKSGQRVVFIALADIQERLAMGSLAEDYLRHLEIECSRSNIGIDIVGHKAGDADFSFIKPGAGAIKFADEEAVVGYLFPISAQTAGMEHVFRFLAHVRKPVALLDFTGGWQLPAYLCKENVRLFSSAVSPRSGRQVARYLLSRGHRNIAYISPFHKSLWSQNRLKGIREIYAQAGIDNSVLSFTQDNPPRYFRFYFEDETKGYSLERLLASYNAWKKDVPLHIRQKTDQLFGFQLPERIIPLAEMQHTISPLFKKAIAKKECTAWVVANDDIALWALEYLQQKNIKVPNTVSIVGFDDTHAAMNQGLTSYNFNMNAIAHAMLGFVLNKRSLSKGHSHRAIEFEGMIIERQTVRTYSPQAAQTIQPVQS